MGSVGFACVVLLAFVRLATLPVVFPQPLDIATALDVVDSWLRTRPTLVVQPTTLMPAYCAASCLKQAPLETSSRMHILQHLLLSTARRSARLTAISPGLVACVRLRQRESVPR